MVHSTTLDNERGVASGWSDPPLSRLGVKQARDLRKRIEISADVIYASDLLRSRQTANLIFPESSVIPDARLREMDYGVYNGVRASTLPSLPPSERFPGGESLEDVYRRVNDLVESLNYQRPREVLFISHRAPQISLEVRCNNLTWEQALSSDWRLTNSFRSYWCYNYEVTHY